MEFHGNFTGRLFFSRAFSEDFFKIQRVPFFLWVHFLLFFTSSLFFSRGKKHCTEHYWSWSFSNTYCLSSTPTTSNPIVLSDGGVEKSAFFMARRHSTQSLNRHLAFVSQLPIISEIWVRTKVSFISRVKWLVALKLISCCLDFRVCVKYQNFGKKPWILLTNLFNLFSRLHLFERNNSGFFLIFPWTKERRSK